MSLFLLRGREVLRLVGAAVLHRQYAAAMRRRRPFGVLPHNAFGRYVRRWCWGLLYFSPRRVSALLGQWRAGLFCVSHIAPAGMRHGLELVRRVAGEDIPVVFAVTGDLAGMLARLGYRRLTAIQAPFWGQLVEKQVFCNQAALEFLTRSEGIDIVWGALSGPWASPGITPHAHARLPVQTSVSFFAAWDPGPGRREMYAEGV